LENRITQREEGRFDPQKSIVQNRSIQRSSLSIHDTHAPSAKLEFGFDIVDSRARVELARRRDASSSARSHAAVHYLRESAANN